MAEWLHLFPSRTEQLSTHTPKIVFAKIGRCLIFFFALNFFEGVMEGCGWEEVSNMMGHFVITYQKEIQSENLIK